MDNKHSQIVAYIWGIADELRDVFVRGQYRDIILPFTVLRRLDAMLEDTHLQVMEELKDYSADEIRNRAFDEGALTEITGVNYYNISKFTLADLSKSDDPTTQYNNFVDYVDGFNSEVQEVLRNFDLTNKVRKLTESKKFNAIINKICDKDINLSAKETTNSDGLTLPALSNIDMGMVFEELLRKFNEENNEEAGEHFTPRDAIRLLSRLIFEPIKDNLPRTISIYDPACGSGGMLTESFDFIVKNNYKKEDGISLYGTEINPETYAICKSDLIIKKVASEGINKGNTIASDNFAGQHFGYMITNPPYGKAWGSDKEAIGTTEEGLISDSRYRKRLRDYWGKWEECDCSPRTSDGQLLFILELVDKMKPLSKQPQGSRCASIHNGSSLFTGDAGSGESNTRRFLIENDLVEAIIQLPNNIFYNTGIATYVWILSNNKDIKRRNQVQLIDASNAYDKLRKNQGFRNCTISSQHQDNILDIYKNFVIHQADSEVNIESKIFDNDDFRYYDVQIERPLRLKSQFTRQRVDDMLFDAQNYDVSVYLWSKYGKDLLSGISHSQITEFKQYLKDNGMEFTDKKISALVNSKKWTERANMKTVAELIMKIVGDKVYMDYNILEADIAKAIKDICKEYDLSKDQKSASIQKKIARAVSEVCPDAEKVIKKRYQTSADLDSIKVFAEANNLKEALLPDYGFCKVGDCYVEYEPDTDLRDTEKIPVKQDIYSYFIEEVRAYVSDAWIDISKTKIGCEISFNKYFYKPVPLRTLAENEADILELDAKSQGFIQSLLNTK